MDLPTWGLWGNSTLGRGRREGGHVRAWAARVTNKYGTHNMDKILPRRSLGGDNSATFDEGKMLLMRLGQTGGVAKLRNWRRGHWRSPNTLDACWRKIVLYVDRLDNRGDKHLHNRQSRSAFPNTRFQYCFGNSKESTITWHLLKEEGG